MAISKTLTLSSGVSYAPYGELIVTETATSIPNNTSTLSIKLVLHRPYAIQSTATKTASATINGTTHSWSGTIGGSGDLTLINKTQTVTHDSDGTKEDMSISAKIQLDVNWGGTQIGTISNSGTMDLSDIPRYATVTQSLASKTETTITMNWSSDSIIDYIWYSTNDGSSWTGINVTDGKSGSYTITGLSSNTLYKVKTSVRRKDSQLSTNSTKLEVTTYAYPYASGMPNFTIGNQLTITVYNPLRRTFRITVIAADDTERTVAASYNGTSVVGFRDESYQNFWYSSIPNAKSGRYKVRITYGSHAETRTGGTYSVNESECTPTITALSYADINPVSTAVTQDDSLIVQNISSARFLAEGLSAKHSATLSSVSVSVNNTTHTMSITPSGDSAVSQGFEINSGSNVIATVTVTDSRGIKATKTVTVKMAEWNIPSAIITMERRNNYYSETDITIDADWSFVDGKNSVTIQYKYKKVEDTEWSALVTAEDNVTSTFTADNLFEWNVRIIVTDRFGGTATYNKTLQIGMPIIFIDRKRESFGINSFPQSDKGLWLNGIEIDPTKMIKWTDLDQFNHLYPDSVHSTGLSFSQGMACDGSSIYLTHRSSVSNTVPMQVSKLSLDDYSVESTHTLTTGHYNNMYFYDGKLYSSGAAVLTGNEVDYTKVAVTDAQTFSTVIKTMPSNWGVGIKKFNKRGTVTALYIPSTRNMSLYASYEAGSEAYQVPLTEVTLDYTGCTTVQGSFHMTQEYLWVLESAYNADTIASGHQVVRCFSYSGMLIRSFYLEGTNDEELEDIWVSDDNLTMIINDAKGNIYKYTLPKLYRTLSSSISEVGTLKAGAYKHVYACPSPLDTKKTFTRSGSTYTAYTAIVLSDFCFASEIGYFETPMLSVNGGKWAGNINPPLGLMTFSGSYEWAGGGVMSWRFEFSRRSTSTNYEYYLSKANVRIRDSSTNKEYSETSSDGDISDTSSGMGKMFSELYSAGWIYGDFFIDSLTYIVGVPKSSNSLGLL